MMKKPFICLLLGILLPLPAAAVVECPTDRTCVMKQSNTKSKKSYTRCWKLADWFRCSKYRSVTYYRLVCCPGYGGPGCLALCNNNKKTNRDGACDQEYENDSITYRDFNVQNKSGGICKAPNCCEKCNSGFYADCNGYCTICPYIRDCEYRKCDSYYGSENKCEYCKYEHAHQRYERAYKYHDVNKACEQTCSWRPDSTRCFPGNCSDEFKQSCICADGFVSPSQHCTRIITPINITDAHVQFVDINNTTVSSPDDVNKPNSVPKKWTNLKELTILEFNVTSIYKVPGTIPKFGSYNVTKIGKDNKTVTEEFHHFVTNFSYGIIGGTMRALYKPGNNVTQSLFKKTECNDTCNRDKPCDVNSAYRCESGKVSVDYLRPFMHNDWLNVSVSLENGGFLIYENRDDRKSYNDTGKWTNTTKVYLKGIQTTESYIFHWDTEPPYYSCIKLFTLCLSPLPVYVPDISKIGVINIHWKRWSDDLSGIDYYNIEVYKMHPVGNGTEENEIVELLELAVKQPGIRNLSSIIEVAETGMYAVHFSAFDRAGNFETARAFFLYDTNELIDLHNGQIKVLKSVQYLEKGWITYSNPFIEVEWKDKFVKTEHFKNSWLAKIKTDKDVENVYDDNSGKRNMTLVPNVKGIVKFEIGHDVYGTSLKSSSPLTHVSSVYSQTSTQNVIWDDGDQVVVIVRAFDILDNYRDENVTAYKDSSPPIISNLWLTKDDRVNIAVHSVEEFEEMVIEWDAYDYHSGISHLNWRLYDNFTGSDIIHGNIDLPGQGETQTLAECKDEFKDYTRGAFCYCTKYTGCYHKHFYVKPHIAVEDGNGLVHNRSTGVHDSDYYIDVNVTNMATLTTLKTIKITIDITPPVAGHVHDGVYGSPEVDYQQDLRLDVHWEGFFDHESGVAFYQYEFSEVCLSGEHFQNKSLTNDTYDTFASYNAPNPGTYYVTVVAYNRAYDMSQPVCSDGVTITTIVPSVKNVIVTHARTKPRLVRDGSGNEWYIDNTLQRHILENNTDSCKFSDPLTEAIAVFPVSQTPVNAHIVCEKTRSYSTLVTRVIPSIHMLNITWAPVVDAVLIDDYEVGLASVHGSSAPDIMRFQSSRRHTHILINHFGVPEGKLFYIIIKSISKSNVMGSQSVGPLIQDTTSPQFVGTDFGLSVSGNYLVANWSAASFEDSDNPFALDYEYAIGHTPYSTDIQQYSIVGETGPCVHSSKYMCTATNILDLDWKLHGHHVYYVTIKATNLAGQYVTKSSVPYIHDILLPTRGLVIDVPGNSSAFTPVKDIEDIDYTTITDHLAVRWRKFYHSHLNLTYYTCLGTASGICDVDGKKKITGNINIYLFSGLSLTPFKRYYSTVFAETSTGSVFVTSDGVTVVDPTWSLPDLTLMDGENCTDNLPLNTSHHDKDTRPKCAVDKAFQVSTTTLSTYFQIPFDYIPFITHAFWSIDERYWLGEFWNTFNEIDNKYFSIQQYNNLTVRDLTLEPGRTYRLSVKFCADEVCFPALNTSGVTIIPNKPVAGPISIEYTNHTNNTDKMEVVFANMYDPDILDKDEARQVVTYYEYSLQDSSYGIYHSWLKADTLIALNSSFSHFTIHLLGQMDFSKCRIIALRGYNRAGVWQTAFAEIKQCKVHAENQIIVPNIVVDGIGEQQLNGDGSIRDGYGKEIYLEENDRWNTEDVDYSPYKNILSAVWHSLRHKEFTWAVIEIKTLDAVTYYKDFNNLHLSDPCSHPDVVTCGHTENAFINVLFNDDNPLAHGKRYTMCIHAPSKPIHHEKWTELLGEINVCSDGITVDLTSPITGKVWIGPVTEIQYKTTTSDIFVNWESFMDVEEYGTASHSTGIRQYQVAIGSVEGGSDIVEFTHVGIVNHVTFHNLNLQNGHDYFASVKGIDFSGRSSTAHSVSIRVDTTPPHQTSKPILIDGRHIRNFSEINACWKDVFYDLESGIKHYILEVGSKPNFGDIVQPIETNEDCEVSIQYLDINAHQGHPYFITVKAVNKANLVTTASSWGYIYDKTPPEVGQVFDGFLNDIKLTKKDIDFQTNSAKLGAHWEKFYDPHTTIKTYKIAIGTCAGCDDVLQTHDIGLIHEFVLKGINFAVGRRYYTTVTACNTADLCSSVTSDGVIIDNSPPNIGKIKDGADYIDINYQSLRSYVAATWYGFNDPQSGLDKYSIRVGTSIGGNDIISQTDLPLTDIVVFPNITEPIPTNTRIYVTVRAYNKAGLYSEAASNGLLVDDSPPIFSSKPKLFQQLGSRRENSIIYRSGMKITWEVSDGESYIERQYISVNSHKGGEINSTSTELNGIVRDFTYTRLNLHDGGEYFVTVIACNGAKACITESSEGIFVDNSPPITGSFAIETDHAAEFNRHVDGWWMKWSSFKLWLAWIGFSDLHSDIDYYMVSVGSRYMLDDLNSDNRPKKFQHKDDGIDKGDEGKVQTFEVDTTKLTDYDYVFISVWAFNKVGLQSDMIHNQFRLIPGGSLELIRRCSSNTCLGHCVCAPKDQRCPIEESPCVDSTHNNTNTLIAIYDLTDLRQGESEDVNFTPSHDALAARWRIVQIQGLLPQWYEWSVGITDSTEPEGIIDNSVENIWHPCGQIDYAIYTLPRGKVLNDFQRYSFFVRAWYDSNTFADFKSDGITVMSKPLTTTNFVGAGVMEHLPGHWKKDIDYMLRGGLFSISWHEAFIKASTVIEKFHVYLSTYQGGHDIHKVEIDIPGSVSTVNISRVPLLPGVWYFSNVVGYSYAGQHVTLSSDGFTVDIDTPLIGVVHDGIGHREIDFQNSSEVVGASWSGFVDHDSGIQKYYWCVQNEITNTECDVLPFQNVGIQRSISKSINSSIIHSGAKVVSKVYAVDFVGHVSDIATSDGITIDETPPKPVKLIFTENSMIKNPSFEDSDNDFVDISNISAENICGYTIPYHWNSSDEDYICVLGSSKSIAMDGRSFLFLRGSVLQTLYNLQIDNTYSIKFFTAHVPFEYSVLSTKEGYIEFGTERHVFLVYQRQDKHGSDIEVSWHSHTFFFTAKNTNVNISFGSMDDTTGILLDNIQISKAEVFDEETNSYPVLSHAIWLHEWSSIHASWQFIDEESPIVEYLWAIGYKEGSTEIQRYTSVGLNTFANNYNISLAHTSTVHITVVSINGAGLSAVATAEALYIDLTPPDIEFVYDGIGYDIDSQTTDEIIANWRVEDLESGLSYCEWAIGFSEFGNEVQAFVRISAELSSVSKVFDHSVLSSKTVYVTLRCHNKAGLHSKKSSDGVTISDSPPSIQNAQVQVLDQPITEYKSKSNFHGNTSTVRLKWMGFHDKSGLDSFLVKFENQDKTVSLSKTVLYDHDGVMYCSMTGFELHDEQYVARVSAINNAFMSSQPVSTNISVSTKNPRVSETNSITMSEKNRTLTISWDTYFTSAFTLYYEVSVGTAVNGADIVQWQETTNEFLVMHVPLRVKFLSGMNIYITITAIGLHGQHTTKTVALTV